MENVSKSDYGIKDIFPKKEAKESPLDDSVRIYDVNDLGLKDIIPSTIIEREPISGDIKLYTVNEVGIKNITPYEVIRKSGADYNVYAVNKIGLPELTPKRVIEVNKQADVFGVLLLPSIKKIKFEQGHPKLKDILHAKDTPDSQLKKEGWIKSKPKNKADKE